MPSENNLSAVFTDIANAIREKSGSTEQMKPINMADNITAIKTSSLKTLLDATKSTYYLFEEYKGDDFANLITYNDTSNVLKMDFMFNYCTNLTYAPLLNTAKVTSMRGMFYGCNKLISVPSYDTSNVKDMNSTFSMCSKLTTIPNLDVSNVTTFNSAFSLCSSLKSILMHGMKVSFDISPSARFEKSDLVTILNNLAVVTTNQTLKMGSNNLAKLTDEEKAIATNKGWTLQ